MLIWVVIAIVIIVIIYNLPASKEARAKKAAEAKVREEAADVLVETSEHTKQLADYLVNYFSDLNGEAIDYLRQRQTFLRLTVTKTGLWLEKDTDIISSKLYSELHYDEKNHMLPPQARSLAYLVFQDADWENLPNDQAANSLKKYIISKLSELPFLTIKKDYTYVGDDRIYYTPQKSGW